MSQLFPEQEEERHSLLDLLDRLMNQGVAISGDLVISVADVDLLYLGLRLLLTSVQTAVERGMLPEEGGPILGGGEVSSPEGAR